MRVPLLALLAFSCSPENDPLPAPTPEAVPSAGWHRAAWLCDEWEAFGTPSRQHDPKGEAITATQLCGRFYETGDPQPVLRELGP